MTDNCEHRTLPPKVKGKLHGHLTLIVDEVVWCGKQAENVIVQTKLWGDEKPVIFRPCNIASLIDTQNRHVKEMFDIRTNTSLFENYLKNCRHLEFYVLKEDSKELVGRAFLSEPHRIIDEVHIQKYCPISNSIGVKVGDLHVVLNLWLKQQRQPAEKEGDNHVIRSVDSNGSSEEQIRPLHKRRGCKACTKRSKMTGKKIKSDTPEGKPLHSIEGVSQKSNTVPPNTVRSDHSEALLSDIYERGEKLRKAMVMSILEDCSISNIEEEFSELDRQTKMSIKDEILRNFVSQSISKAPSVVTDEVKVMDYLLGKEMTKEDEMQALKTLRTVSPLPSVLNLGDLEKPDTRANSDEYCLSSGREYRRYAEKSPVQQKTDTPKSNIIRSEHEEVLQQKESGSDVPEWCKKVNTVRISVELLRLTASGVRKMCKALQKDYKQSKNSTRDLAPSSVTYFVEAYFTEKNDSNTSYNWRHKPNERFCSRKEVESVVYFGQSCVRYLSTPFTVNSMNSWLLSSQWVVFWRQLNQRVPLSLGNIIMENLPEEPYLEKTFTFPVGTENTINGYARFKIELGKGKHCFGYSLIDERNHSTELSKSGKIFDATKMSASHETGIKHSVSEETKENIEPTSSSTDKACQSGLEIETSNRHHSNRETSGSFLYDNLMSKDVTTCPNCREYQNVKDSELPKTKYPSVYFPLEKFYVCSMCKTWFNKTHKHGDVLPKQVVSDDCVKYRVHEFVVGIENIEGASFSKESYEDKSCYVDYKFFQTDIPGCVKLSSAEFTSKTVDCSKPTNFSTVHRHCLCLPDNVPLATTLGPFYPGISFRLWIRRYTPTPRDHMAAVALLSLDKICTFDWKFDSKNKDSPVIEVFELPLTLIKSLPTSDLASTEQNICGKLHVSVSYRKYNNEMSGILSHEQRYTEKEEVLINAGKENSDIVKELGSTDRREYNQVKDNNEYSKQYEFEENGTKEVYSNTDATVDLRAAGLPGREEGRIDKETVQQTDYNENELRYLRRRFWTGEYGTNHYDTSRKPYLGVSSHDQGIEVSKNLKNNSKTLGRRVEFNPDSYDFKKTDEDLTHVPDYRVDGDVCGLASNDSRYSKYRSRVNFCNRDYDTETYKLKHRSYDSLTDGLSKVYSEDYIPRTSLRQKSDDAHRYRVKHLSYDDIRESSYVDDMKPRPSDGLYSFHSDALTQKSYESLRETENIDLKYGTQGKQLQADCTEPQVNMTCHRQNKQLVEVDVDKNYDSLIDTDMFHYDYRRSGERVDTDKRYTSDSGSKSLLVETDEDHTSKTNEPLYDTKCSSTDLPKTSDSCVRGNSAPVNSTTTNNTINSHFIMVTSDESELTVIKNDSQYYKDDESGYHKIISENQTTESTGTIEIFIANKDAFNANKSDDSVIESHITYTDGKGVENLCEIEKSDNESEQSLDKSNKKDGSVKSFQSENEYVSQNIELQQTENSLQDNDNSHDPVVADMNQASHSPKECFRVCVEIEQAMHLPMKSKIINGVHTLVQPSTYVTFKAAGEGRDVLYSTGIVQQNCNPVWNKSWEVDLPTELLQEVDKRLVFSICEEDMGRDFVLGHAAADLTLFLYGLPFLRSWININDFRATCIGQIKINVLPLEDISRYHKNSFMTSTVYDTDGKYDHYRKVPDNASVNKTTFRQSRKSNDDKLECKKSEMTVLGEKLTELDNMIRRFEKKLYLSSQNELSPNRRRFLHDSVPEIKSNHVVTVIDSDDINQCGHNGDTTRTNIYTESVHDGAMSSHCDAHKNVQTDEDTDGNVISTSQNNCVHCSCRCCLNISDRSESDDIRLQYLLNPLLFHHLLANISQTIRTEVPTCDAGYQTEFSEFVSNEELASRPLASGMSAPEEEICRNDTDTSVLELEQICKNESKEQRGMHCNDSTSEFVENSFLSSANNSLLQSETPRFNGQNPEGREDRKKPENVARRLQRQNTFVIDKHCDCGDNTGEHSK